ncbi:MAG: DUF192 domain-containing protein [Elusimicrobiota bacterium]
MDTKKLRMGGDPTGINVSIAGKFADKALGWMFKKVRDDMGLLLLNCSSIHTLFMFSAIDVIFLDSKYSIVKIIPNLRPWRLVFPVSGARMVLELPLKSALSFGLKKGDKLEIA